MYNLKNMLLCKRKHRPFFLWREILGFFFNCFSFFCLFFFSRQAPFYSFEWLPFCLCFQTSTSGLFPSTTKSVQWWLNYRMVSIVYMYYSSDINENVVILLHWGKTSFYFYQTIYLCCCCSLRCMFIIFIMFLL